MRHILSRIAFLIRRRRSPSKGPMTVLGIDEPMRVNSATVADDQADIARRLALMPLFVREVYLLRAVDGMSIDEISKRLGISPQRTKKHLQRAIILLAASRRDSTAPSV